MGQNVLFYYVHCGNPLLHFYVLVIEFGMMRKGVTKLSFAI